MYYIFCISLATIYKTNAKDCKISCIMSIISCAIEMLVKHDAKAVFNPNPTSSL